jgi:hypothetical protein
MPIHDSCCSAATAGLRACAIARMPARITSGSVGHALTTRRGLGASGYVAGELLGLWLESAGADSYAVDCESLGGASARFVRVLPEVVCRRGGANPTTRRSGA